MGHLQNIQSFETSTENGSLQRYVEEHIVQQISDIFWTNCGIYGKSTKFGTDAQWDQGSNSGYGPQLNFVVFHNGGHYSKWLPRFLSMGT